MVEPRTIRRFVKALLPARRAECDASGRYVFERSGRTFVLDADTINDLVHRSVLGRNAGGSIVPGAAAATWLKRQSTPPAGGNAPGLNLEESPVGRLAIPAGSSEAFLAAHHVEAANRIRRLTDRAQMVARTTMSYDPTRLPRAGGAQPGAVIGSETALEARRELRRLLDPLPRDCAGVVLDVCGLLKGLQVVETERRWPRRSAKLVLRIGLEQVAAAMGLMTEARGRENGRARAWIEERPTRFE